MRLNKIYEIERAASKDLTRQHLCHCYLDVEKKRLVATDGHMLVSVPVTDLDKSPGPCPQDESGFVPTDVIKQARKLTPKTFGGDTIVSANGEHVFIGGATAPRPSQKDCHFPPYEQVIPDYREGTPGTVTVALDAKLLLELAKAIGKGGGGAALVKLTFPIPGYVEPEDSAELLWSKATAERVATADMLDPFVVEGADGALGILMPSSK
jgi:hypothetical protein